MNQDEQKTALSRYGFDSSDPLLGWLNAALHEIESYEDWTWLEDRATITVVAGTTSLTFADLLTLTGKNIFKVQSMWNAVIEEKLQEMERTRFDRTIRDPATTGSPCIYVMTGPDTIQFYPVPDVDTEIDITFFKYLDDMVDGSRDSPLPVRFHYVQVLRAAAFALMAENEEERANAAMNQYEASMSRISSRYDDRTDDEPQSVTDVQGYHCS